MAGYGYYPYFTQQNYSGAFNQQCYAPPSCSTTSESDTQFNQAPVSSNWLYQGTNATSYNPYIQSYPGYVSPQSYNTMFTQYAPTEEKTFTQQSHKSQKTELSRAGSPVSQRLTEPQQNVSEDLNQITPQIEAAYEAATGKRRQPVVKRQVITMPGEAGRVQQVVRRLPTPTPDVIERVFIVKPQRDTINLIIERPATPPVQYKDKTVYGKTRRPIINPKIVSVAPRHMYQQLENGGYPQGYQAVQDYAAYQHQASSEHAQGYLLSPLRYDEQGKIVENYDQSQQSYLKEQTLDPTFSTSILQPYNPPMLEQYQHQMGYQYPQNFTGQYF